MGYFVYNLLIWVGSPILALWVALRLAAEKMPGLTNRLSFFPASPSPSSGPTIWLHAVSLGETKIAVFLAGKLRSRLPGARIIMTSSTRTGFEEARRNATPGDVALYPPFDYRWICRRFLRKLRPDALIVVETELWPNLFREARRAGAALLLVNGRVSDRSFGRYRATRFFWRDVLAHLDALLAQSERDAERFRAIGAAPSALEAAGNLKRSLTPASTALAEALRAAVRAGSVHPILVAGSTMPGEEHLLLQCFQTLRAEFPSLWMILAPRHPERCFSVASETSAFGILMQLRSAWEPGQPLEPGVFLLDTTGELASLYAIADAAFIGGTLVPTGGHNVIEPAQAGCPTVIGPSIENFRDLVGDFLKAPGLGVIPQLPGARAGAILQVPDPEHLTEALRYLFRDPDAARRLGAAAREIAGRQDGAAERVLSAIESCLAAKAGRKTAADPDPQPAAAGAGPWGRT